MDHDKDFLSLHRRIRRQYGRQPVLLRQVTAEPDSMRVGGDAGRIAEEVIAHLAGLVGADEIGV